MESQLIEAQSLAIIDEEIGEFISSPAQYEIIRRVIYKTADFEYQFLIGFGDRALEIGAAVLACRTTIIVDVPMVKAGIQKTLKKTFINPVYCASEVPETGVKKISQTAWGIQVLAKRYPEAMYIIGEDQIALKTVIELATLKIIKPALIIATPCNFIDHAQIKEKLTISSIPYIATEERKGGVSVAVAITNALIDLAWQIEQAQENFVI